MGERETNRTADFIGCMRVRYITRMHPISDGESTPFHRTDGGECLSYSVKDAAKIIGISPRRLWDHVKNKKIQTFRDGARRLISRRAIEAFIAAREAESDVA